MRPHVYFFLLKQTGVKILHKFWDVESKGGLLLVTTVHSVVCWPVRHTWLALSGLTSPSSKHEPSITQISDWNKTVKQLHGFALWGFLSQTRPVWYDCTVVQRLRPDKAFCKTASSLLCHTQHVYSKTYRKGVAVVSAQTGDLLLAVTNALSHTVCTLQVSTVVIMLKLLIHGEQSLFLRAWEHWVRWVYALVWHGTVCVVKTVDSHWAVTNSEAVH